jgi:homoserine acetyltransferase
MSLVVLNGALGSFDVSDQLGQIQAPVFYVLCDTDEFYPAHICSRIVDDMKQAGADITFHRVSSHMGHYSTSAEPEKWVPQAREFLANI